MIYCYIYFAFSSLLPGKIRVLKTKCYMKMKQWKKALSSADEAMFRLFEAQGRTHILQIIYIAVVCRTGFFLNFDFF